MSPAWRRRIGRPIVAVLALAAGLVLGEVLCRLFPLPASELRRLLTASGDARGHVLRPGARMVFRGLHEPLEPPVVWQVDGGGRRSDREIAPATEKWRVLVYGDSEAFGWGVALDDTFQRVLERRFPDLEVINLGVPGYNVSAVALHVERTAAALTPDLLVYLVHPNDFEPPLPRPPEALLRSELGRRVFFTWVAGVVDPRHERTRRSAERVEAFVDGMGRIVAVCRELGVECVAVFLDRRDLGVVARAPDLAGYLLAPGAGRAIDLTRVAAAWPRFDRHLSVEAHLDLARALEERLRPPGGAREAVRSR